MSRILSVARFAAPAASLLLAGAVVLTGCNTNRPEKNPFLIEKFAQIDESLKDFAKMKRELVILQDDLKFLTEELTTVRSASSGLTPAQQEQIASTLTKLDEMQELAKKLEAQSTQRASQVASAVPAPAAAPAAAATGSTPAPRPAASVAPRPQAPSAPASRPVAVAPASNRPAAAASTQRRSAFYYSVKAGDTLDKVAQANGASPAALAKANGLPAGAAIVPGQRLWVP